MEAAGGSFRVVATVGLTGGVGSGKSTVAALLGERGGVVLDADALTRELQQPGQPVYEATVARFGPGVVDADGSLDRSALAGIVFADPSALADLEALTHPAVRQAMLDRLAEVRSGGGATGTGVVILEVPLLLEVGGYPVAGVVVVDCPVETAVHRLVSQRGMTEAGARARMARQLSREERRARADVVIDNSGLLSALSPQVDRTWAWIKALPDA